MKTSNEPNKNRRMNGGFFFLRFMKEIGGKHAAVDMMKNWLLNSKKGDVDFLLGKGVVSRKVLIEASAGHMIVMSPAEMAQAAVKGIKKLPLLLNLAVLLQKMKKECKTASNMPKYYDEAALPCLIAIKIFN